MTHFIFARPKASRFCITVWTSAEPFPAPGSTKQTAFCVTWSLDQNHIPVCNMWFHNPKKSNRCCFPLFGVKDVRRSTYFSLWSKYPHQAPDHCTPILDGSGRSLTLPGFSSSSGVHGFCCCCCVCWNYCHSTARFFLSGPQQPLWSMCSRSESCLKSET